MLPLNLNHFQTYNTDNLKVSQLTQNKLKTIENEKSVSIGTKIELIQILNGDKWITEIEYNEKNCDSIAEFLNRIELPFYKENYKNHKWLQLGSFEFRSYDWFQIGANQAILEYLKERREILTEFEAGILYGYPTSAVLAFSGLIAKGENSKKVISEFIFSGISSKDFKRNERAYFDLKWEKIKNLSPKLADEAIKYYSQFLKN